jgi:predicted RNA-binding Zn-ribbon protein involved in translation (DUF1610 family)
MNLLYCARCTTPLMSAATVHICPACGAVFRQQRKNRLPLLKINPQKLLH